MLHFTNSRRCSWVVLGVNAQGTPFLQELVSRWNEHNKSTQMIRDILMVRKKEYFHA
jgi:hypothetical protein